jgi:hypothetical protein
MANSPFSQQSTVHCHGSTTINVLYTNMATSVQPWIKKAEDLLSGHEKKIAGIDVEYTKDRDRFFNPKKAVVIQLCVGTEVFVYHICHADEESASLYNFLHGWRYVFASFDVGQDKKVLTHANLFCHNYKDIQEIWRDPNRRDKRTQGLKDVVGAIIDT